MKETKLVFKYTKNEYVKAERQTMSKRLALLFILTSLITNSPVALAASTYSDVPEDSWAESTIEAAAEYGLMNGVGGGVFGYGREISRAEFATLICRMFDWELIAPDAPSFPDVQPDDWYYTYVETTVDHNAVYRGGAFSPKTPITREDMSVMLVRALGYEPIAEAASEYSMPFTDVISNRGYIAIAYDIGMTNGTSATAFSPDNTAKREEAAAMLVRVYEKYISKTDYLHGFYAFSSYSQRYVTDNLDAVSFGWSNMNFDFDRGAWLNTSYTDDNQWAVPDSYESITSYLEENYTKAHLSVFMDTSQTLTYPDGTASNSLEELLISEENRVAAVAAIVDEVSREYVEIGKNPYSGVTIDFEGLKGRELKSGFTAFLTLLSSELKNRDMTLYVAVQPVLADGVYFDAYDYRAIGELADKVILMAHNYNATSLEGFVGTEWHKTTALTPIASVYYSLRAITDKETGVEDKSKIVLAISFATIGWEITEEGKVKSGEAQTPSIPTVYQRLLQENTVTGWSEQYKNPYITYYTESGQKIFLYYENEESVAEKITLAKLFGITGVSLWRIGIIPDYADVYDVWGALVG